MFTAPALPGAQAAGRFPRTMEQQCVDFLGFPDVSDSSGHKELVK